MKRESHQLQIHIKILTNSLWWFEIIRLVAAGFFSGLFFIDVHNFIVITTVFFFRWIYSSWLLISSLTIFSNDVHLYNKRIFFGHIFCPCHYAFSRCNCRSLVINPIWFWNIRSVSLRNLLEASKDWMCIPFCLAK